ncbi:carbohydrate ABC transporter permease [Halanaerobium saccharolyticum]|jgi:putative chitobiose transport system permease protein|uniref:Carbohydrate ABC transporter membrane protein 2 (CUT1 family) n=1 Tax=Halanaerobium saccharolyticum TaxID=43595 RepID=A0A4R6SEN7_9FIRM|nr:carbohydrate ABC transporter permease [Halanaerobium saccharolyticum]TDP98207.1 carbohydrate ABC transporter membrane protein 2 (CUT1 family) [Halanaerobium saccharolyticum]
MSKSLKEIIKTILIYLLLITIALIMIGPFLWLLSTALKSGGENIFQYPPSLIPESPTLVNFLKVREAIAIERFFLNSTFVALVTIAINVFVSALAAYPLARMDFTFKNIIFYGILGTMMVPFQILMISIYIFSVRTGMTDSYQGLILPVAVNAFGIFLLRQAFLTIPVDIEEAAVIDGCNSFQIWWKVLLPLVKPSIATLSIFTFMMSWSRFMWPLIVISNPDYYTLPVGISYLSGLFSSNWRLIASGSLISIIPIIVIFLFLQRYFIKGAMAGAVKG